MKPESKKRATAFGCVLAIAITSVLLVGASSTQQTTEVRSGSLTEQLVARATVAAAEGIVVVGAPAGKLDELRGAVGDVVKKDAVLAVVVHGDERHQVLAPIGGTILRVHAALGANVGPNAPVLDMARLDRLEVRIEIDATQARHVVVGREVKLRDLGGSEVRARGAIARVSPTVGPRSVGATDARIRAEGVVVAAWIPLAPDSGLVLGEEHEGVLVLPEGEVATLLPHAAVDIEEGHAIVRLPGRLFASKRRVRLGRSDLEHVEVHDLAAGTHVLMPR